MYCKNIKAKYYLNSAFTKPKLKFIEKNTKTCSFGIRKNVAIPGKSAAKVL